MGNEKAEELVKKYLEGTATPEEEALLETWYMEMAQQQPDPLAAADYPAIGEEIAQALLAEQRKLAEESKQRKLAEDSEQQKQLEQPKPKTPIRLWPRIAAAAAVILALVIGSVLLLHKDPPPPIARAPLLEHDILPAGSRGTLTLLDGHTIPLDSTNNTTLARQPNATISTIAGQLVYTATQPPATQAPATQEASNTLTTRPGEHYSIQLPDGTKAWLDAASSITYPVAFNGSQRNVEITGEVYFEIVHNPKQPFHITVKDQLIEDIGTHLNIDAYDDAPVINTTLLEGSIKVSKGNASVVLKPGDQSTIAPGDSEFLVTKVDADQAIAWKNGYFLFDHADIKTVMREIARWYDIQVVYKGEISKKTFKGKIYRNINASEALRILSYFGAHFEIKEKTITVTF